MSGDEFQDETPEEPIEEQSEPREIPGILLKINGIPLLIESFDDIPKTIDEAAQQQIAEVLEEHYAEMEALSDEELAAKREELQADLNRLGDEVMTGAEFDAMMSAMRTEFMDKMRHYGDDYPSPADFLDRSAHMLQAISTHATALSSPNKRMQLNELGRTGQFMKSLATFMQQNGIEHQWSDEGQIESFSIGTAPETAVRFGLPYNDEKPIEQMAALIQIPRILSILNDEAQTIVALMQQTDIAYEPMDLQVTINYLGTMYRAISDMIEQNELPGYDKYRNKAAESQHGDPRRIIQFQEKQAISPEQMMRLMASQGGERGSRTKTADAPAPETEPMEDLGPETPQQDNDPEALLASIREVQAEKIAI